MPIGAVTDVPLAQYGLDVTRQPLDGRGAGVVDVLVVGVRHVGIDDEARRNEVNEVDSSLSFTRRDHGKEEPKCKFHTARAAQMLQLSDSGRLVQSKKTASSSRAAATPRRHGKQ